MLPARAVLLLCSLLPHSASYDVLTRAPSYVLASVALHHHLPTPHIACYMTDKLPDDATEAPAQNAVDSIDSSNVAVDEVGAGKKGLDLVDGITLLFGLYLGLNFLGLAGPGSSGVGVPEVLLPPQ